MLFEKITSYLGPEGKDHIGTIENAELKVEDINGRTRERARLTMSDETADDGIHDFKVAKDYWASEVKEMMAFVYALVGPDVAKLRGKDGNIDPEQLKILIGKKVMFDVTHKHLPGHKEAFRLVTNLRPAAQRHNTATASQLREAA